MDDEETQQTPVVIPIEDDVHQRTLFSLSKVVRLDKSSVCFTKDDVVSMRKQVLDPSKSTHEVCFKVFNAVVLVV